LPAYNEEKTIAQVIESFAASLPAAKILVVDNNSTDRTAVEAAGAIRRTGIEGTILSELRQGKAFAVQKAFREVEADVFILCDADMTYLAAEVHSLLQPVLSGRADMVVGDRHALGGYKSENKRRFHGFGNSLIRDLINSLFRSSLHDILSGYRVFSRHFVKNYPILSRGFDIEAEMTLHALDKGFRIVEVPICYKDRPQGSVSKLNTFRDGFRVLKLIFTIFRNYRPLAFFGSLACFFSLGGLTAGYPALVDYYRVQYVLHVPLAILATGLMIIAFMCLSIALILDTVAANNRFQYALRLVDSSSPLRIPDGVPVQEAGSVSPQPESKLGVSSSSC
jgi:glycosyltransferase involved in cell wall biosynthesis